MGIANDNSNNNNHNSSNHNESLKDKIKDKVPGLKSQQSEKADPIENKGNAHVQSTGPVKSHDGQQHLHGTVPGHETSHVSAAHSTAGQPTSNEPQQRQRSSASSSSSSDTTPSIRHASTVEAAKAKVPGTAEHENENQTDEPRLKRHGEGNVQRESQVRGDQHLHGTVPGHEKGHVSAAHSTAGQPTTTAGTTTTGSEKRRSSASNVQQESRAPLGASGEVKHDLNTGPRTNDDSFHGSAPNAAKPGTTATHGHGSGGVDHSAHPTKESATEKVKSKVPGTTEHKVEKNEQHYASEPTKNRHMGTGVGATTAGSGVGANAAHQNHNSTTTAPHTTHPGGNTATGAVKEQVPGTTENKIGRAERERDVMTGNTTSTERAKESVPFTTENRAAKEREHNAPHGSVAGDHPEGVVGAPGAAAQPAGFENQYPAGAEHPHGEKKGFLNQAKEAVGLGSKKNTTTTHDSSLNRPVPDSTAAQGHQTSSNAQATRDAHDDALADGLNKTHLHDERRH